VVWAAAVVAALALGCGTQADVGSDILWTARFEGGDFSEWTSSPGGSVSAFPAPNMFEASSERAHHGLFAAKLTVDAGADGTQANVGLSRSGDLPVEAFYSAWYYLPRTVTIGTFWVIFKFRMRAVADDATTSAELYDLDLTNLPSGEMSLRLYDHRTGDVPLAVSEPVVPVGSWFQIEALYRNVPDDTGRLTVWLDGQQIVEVADRPMAPTPWVAWDVVSVAVDLDPSAAVLYVDDCALSRTRVGPTGVIAR
jgi:hypothetical protein